MVPPKIQSVSQPVWIVRRCVATWIYVAYAPWRTVAVLEDVVVDDGFHYTRDRDGVMEKGLGEEEGCGRIYLNFFRRSLFFVVSSSSI